MSDFFDALDPLATKRGADLEAVTAERDALREQAIAAHAALDEAGAPACDGVLSGRIAALAADLDQSNRSLGSAMWDRDTLRAEVETLRARLAERPAPPDHRDPPVETAAEATVRRLRNYLSLRTGFDYTSDRHADTDLVAVVSRGFHDEGQTVNNLQAQLERVERIAKEQFEHRLSGT